MATLETVPAEIHFQIFSYLSTATFSQKPAKLGHPDTAWNAFGIHPLEQLYATSKALRNAVEAYCEHRLQHLLAVRSPGKGPDTPFSSPYTVTYLKYMAGRCNFCHTRLHARLTSISSELGVIDFTIPSCWKCNDKFPRSRILTWGRVQQKYGLSLEELKANCAWSPKKELIDPSDSDYVPGRSGIWARQRRRTYAFDERDILRYVERRYGDLNVFFATLEKNRWDKELELERMEKQRRWAREERERRMIAGEAMVARFIAQQEALDKERAEETENMCEELMARVERREEMFQGWQETFLEETAGPEGREDQTGEWGRLDEAANSAAIKLVDMKFMFQEHIESEEKLMRDMLLQRFKRYMKDQVTADVLLKYGLDSLAEPKSARHGLLRGGW